MTIKLRVEKEFRVSFYAEETDHRIIQLPHIEKQLKHAITD